MLAAGTGVDFFSCYGTAYGGLEEKSTPVPRVKASTPTPLKRDLSSVRVSTLATSLSVPAPAAPESA